MNATNDTPRRETTWGEMKIGDVWISNQPINNTLTVTDTEHGPGDNVRISFDDGSAQSNPAYLLVTVIA